jgi:hypothetical protein
MGHDTSVILRQESEGNAPGRPAEIVAVLYTPALRATHNGSGPSSILIGHAARPATVPDSHMNADIQTPFDVAIVMATVVRPSLSQAIRSIFGQRFAGRIQILVGIDRWDGEPAILEALLAERPSHVAVTRIDLGYSTSQRHGGLYPSFFGGALKTILSYAANSRYVTYLDDDNWYAPDHLDTMLEAMKGKVWAFALRHFVETRSGDLLCPDTWESVGPRRGVYAKTQGGFVDTNCFFLDKLACNDVFPEWAMTRAGAREATARSCAG